MYKAVLVDDEAIILDGLRCAVDWDAYGFEIACSTTSSLEALRYLTENKVDLLVTDVSMPEMDGLELLRQGKALHSNLSIIVISAFDRFEYVKTALRCGAENYLLKPIDPEEFAESLGQIAGHMQERGVLASAREYPVLSFRSSLVERWVKNAISSDELQEKARVLGLDLTVTDFTVVMFRLQERAEELMSPFYELVLTSLTGQLYGHFFFDNVGRLVCVLSCPTGKHGERDVISDFADGVVRGAERRGMKLFAAIGCQVSRYDEVHRSYSGTKSLLCLAQTGKRLVRYSDLQPFLNGASMKELSLSLEENVIPGRQFADKIVPPGCGEIPARNAAESLTVCMLDWLGRDLGDLFTPFPELADMLRKFPQAAEEKNYRDWAADFLGCCASTHEGLNQVAYPCVTAAIKSIRSFSDKDICLKSLAAKLNVTPAYLGSLFKRQTGSYFNDYLANARLEYAERLVAETDLKMSDIADQAGFASQTYFNRNFKRCYGVSPVTYRRERKLGKA